MAEAIINARLSDSWQAYSAGSRPVGIASTGAAGTGVHPKTILALEEIGISHAGRSKSMDEFRGQVFDLVVTVCDDSVEDCPVWLPVPQPGEPRWKGRQIHHSFPDPAKTDNLDDFRKVRDAIVNEIIPILIDFQKNT
jgi:arsenate reductase